MRVFHNNEGVNKHFKDPTGHCELINKVTNRPCRAKLSTRSMLYHLEHLHGVVRPDKDHVLLGFITKSFRRAVFVPKVSESEYLDFSSEDEAASEKIPTNEALDVEKEKNSNNEIVAVSSGSGTRVESSYEDTPTFSTSKSAKRKLSISPNLSDLSNISPLASALEDLDNYDLGDLGDLGDIDQMLDLATEPLQQVMSDDNDGNDEDLEELLDLPTESLAQSYSQECGAQYEDDEKKQHPKISSPSSTYESEVKELASSSNSKQQNQSSLINDENLPSVKTSISSKHKKSHQNPIVSEDYSDHEDGDSEEFTEYRRRNKDIRFSKRNIIHIPLHEMTKNKHFMTDFILFMKDNNISTATETPSQIEKYVNHLFMFEDLSFLAFEVKNNPNFNLESLRSFDNSEMLVHLKYPGDWIISTAQNDGNRGIDMLKAHKKLRDFIEYSADKHDSTQEYAVIKKAIRDNLDAIDKQVKKNKLFKKYNDLSNQKKQKKEKAQMILEPSRNVNIETIVKKWNSSAEKESEDAFHESIFQEAVEKNAISNHKFTKYSQYSRMMLFLRLDRTKNDLSSSF